MEFVLELQGLDTPEEMTYGGGGSNGGGSNLSLLASCQNSTVSLLTCH